MTVVKNIPMMRKVMETIEANEDRWDQSAYRMLHPCNTTMCYAGWTCELDPDTEWKEWSGVTVFSGGRRMMAATRAQQILGLTQEEAEEIFFTITTDVGELREIVERVAGERL